MNREWSVLTDEAQLALSDAALEQALAFVAERAERLAQEFEEGGLSDFGGADALRLLTSLIQIDTPAYAPGHA